MSLDLFKAYDRTSLEFLEIVMKAMNFSDTFIDWILLLHHEADTSLLLSFTSQPISLSFSIRQGDPISMVLFHLFMEPLLLRLQDSCTGLFLEARLSRSLEAPLVPGIEEDLEAFVDDTDVVCTSDEDFFRVDKCVGRFEAISGAILNRSKKSVVLGLGSWSEREDWPLKWLKSVKETIVFGFILTHKYEEIIEKNWSSQFAIFKSTLMSWSSRVIDTIYQKSEVLTIFALSKIWFRAQVLPLPTKYAVMFEKEISAFLWRGQITRNVLSRDTACLPKDRGGLGVPHIRHKCRALFI